MAVDFDAVVIGSGFGGSVMACRLSEAGYRVVVLERGRRWDKTTYPREPTDAWIWDQDSPEHRNGWIDLRIFPRMSVAQGAGVGGGSLIYASVSVEPPAETFEQGWPREITSDQLRPYYARVGEMLDVQRLPESQWTARTKLMKEAAAAIGHADRFKTVDLAVTFDPNWTYEQDDPHDPSRSKRFMNRQGREQGTCVHLANCDIGCEVGAKNTLDLNYLARAEDHGADIRPLHLVRNVEPGDSGYRVHFDELIDGGRKSGSVSGRIVIVAGGSLNSTELLLRARDEFGTLPGVSSTLGHNWSSNGDFVTPAWYSGRQIFPTRGPTISSAIDFLAEHDVDGQQMFIEDGGFPNLLSDWLLKQSSHFPRSFRHAMLVRAFRYALRREAPLREVMPWFAQGRDAANGHLRLRKRWWWFGSLQLHLDWNVSESRKLMDGIVAMHRKLSTSTGGRPYTPPTWTWAKDLITPHPLGGCNMGNGPESGVVDHKGEVFGYRNLFVVDGSTVPEALGLNPSKTIAALAERSASIITREGR